MSVDTAPNPEMTRPRTGPVLDVVVPVYNEEADLEPSVRRLHTYLSTQFPYPFRITIADNASVDATPAIATRLAAQLPEVESLRMPEKGRGRALRAAWTASDAQVLAYCDVDLSTDLAALLPLVAPLISGHSDLAIGTRLARDSRVVRGAKREFISRTYNLILRGTLAARFSDAQCGFKAIRGDVAQRLVPLVEDTGWFFDTELLVLAERAGLRIHEVPVDWVDDPNSSVDIVHTATEDLKGIARLGRALATGRVPLQDLREKLGRGALETPEREVAGVPRGMIGQLARFAAIGDREHARVPAAVRAAAGGPWSVRRQPGGARRHRRGQHGRQPRLTFGVRGRQGAATSQVQGLIVFFLGLALTTGALALLPADREQAGRAARAGRGQRARHRAALRRLPVLDLPQAAAPPPPRSTRHDRDPHPDRPVPGHAPAERPGARRVNGSRSAAAGGDGGPPPREPVGERLGQRVLRRRRPVHGQELGGVLLRLVRRGQRRHRRQAARRALGDGAVGAGLRPVDVEHSGAAGADGGGDGRAALRRGPAGGRAGRGAARGRGDGAHAGRGADVPVQQPGRAARAAHGGRRLRRGAGGRARGHALAAARGRADGARVPHQDRPGVPGAARPGAGLPVGGPDRAVAAGPAAARRGRRDGGRGRVVVRRGRAVARGRPALHRRVDRQQRPPARPRLQRPQPDLRPGRRTRPGRRGGGQRDGGRPPRRPGRLPGWPRRRTASAAEPG